MSKNAKVSGSVVAGFPSPAEQYQETPLDLNELLVKRPAATFFVKVQGESMIGEGIYDGDLLVVDRSLRPSSGDVIIACVDGDFTVKTLPFSLFPLPFSLFPVSRLRPKAQKQDTPLGRHPVRRRLRPDKDACKDRQPHRQETPRRCVCAA